MTMKTLIIFLLTVTSIFSQKTSVEVSLPLKTNHFDLSEGHRFAKNQGGNLGLVVSLVQHKGKLNNIYSVGLVRNSYGLASALATMGKELEFNKKASLSLNVGFATNYKDAYKYSRYMDSEGKTTYRRHEAADKNVYEVEENEPLVNALKPLYNIGVLPIGVLTFKYKPVKDFGIIVNVNPFYVNMGLLINVWN